MRTTSILMLASSAALALASCTKKAPEVLPTPPVDAPAPAPAPTPAPTPIRTGPVPGSTADFLATVASSVVYFDTDKSDVDDADKATLRSQATWLARYPNVKVTLEGHCDERGTREYNIALGDRRANAAKNYLATLGVDPARMSTISYGKERPAELGSTDEAWAKNRRAVTVTIE